MRYRIGLVLTCLAAVSLASCGTLGQLVTGSPASVADQTKLDEQAGLTLTLGYTAASRAAALAIQLADTAGHPLSTATIHRIGQLDRVAFAAVTAVRQAYLAGNSANYLTAIVRARAAIADLLGAFGTRPTAQLQLPPSRTFADSYAAARAAHAGLASTTGGVIA